MTAGGQGQGAGTEIDHKERDIETFCMRLLLQPVARDLRTISSALKMISDMERIGDQAGDIAELTRCTREAGTVNMVHIHDMARAMVMMVTDSVDAFVKKDLDLARTVMAADDVVDGLFDKVKRELIRLISTIANHGEFSMDLLMIAKYLERIGDHATNIAEWVEFSMTGALPTCKAISKQFVSRKERERADLRRTTKKRGHPNLYPKSG